MTSPFATPRADGLSASAGGLLIVALTSVTALAATADNPIDYNTARLNRKLIATRAAGPIELDGRLDEPSWLTAPVAKNFIQNDPREGEPATFDTEVQTALRRRLRCSSACSPKTIEPDEIIINELRKDFNTGTSDNFQIVIDTFHDERNGYQFAVNPAGAKWDSQMSNEGRDQNSNWDGVWDVAARIGEDGWYAEIRIPFRTLKFGHGIAPDLGHQFSAPTAPVEREQLLVAGAADLRPVAGVDGRHGRRAPGLAAGQQPARQALRAGQLEPRRHG